MSGVLKGSLLALTSEAVAPPAYEASRLSCQTCGDYFRTEAYICLAGHAACVPCYRGRGNNCLVLHCKSKFPIQSVSVTHFAEMVKGLGLHVSCKYKEQGCQHQDVVGSMDDLHEPECGYRAVSCSTQCGGVILFCDLEAHLHGRHPTFMTSQEWRLGHPAHNRPGFFKFASRSWVENSIRFFSLWSMTKTHWTARVTVMAGRRAASNFQAKITLFSGEMTETRIYNIKVNAVDDMHETSTAEELQISRTEFRSFNNGIDLLAANRMPFKVEILTK